MPKAKTFRDKKPDSFKTRQQVGTAVMHVGVC